mmetsp:Transcript_23641/g.64334  ORF Transcript_23641/g.64334 Transcript_23641/m.64334 type:complete len:216 (-) Transcript_23641:846-1493(-)
MVRMPGNPGEGFSSWKYWQFLLSNLTWFSSILSCLLRMRRAVRNWLSSGRRLAPGNRSSLVFVLSAKVCSVWTSKSLPFGLIILMITKSTFLMTSPFWSCMRLDSPLISSEENSLIVFAWSRPNFDTSTLLVSRYFLKSSSFRPMGAITRPDTSSELSAFSFTFLASACFSVIHSKYFTVFFASSELQGAPVGSPTRCKLAVLPEVTKPWTISFL